MALPRIAPYAMPDQETVPHGRVDWTLDPSRAVLLVHDMQRYFLAAFDEQASPVSELVPNIARLRRACRAAGIPVVYTAQPGDQQREQRGLLQDFWGGGLRAGDDERIVDALTPEDGDVVITKWRYSGLVRTDLLDRVAALGRDQLLVSGIYAHIGCLMTAAHAFMEDVQPFLVADAMADFSLDDHRMALDYAARRCGMPITVERAIAQVGGARVREQVAAVLGVAPGELDDHEELVYQGLDSIRMMSLVAGWRADGIEVTFEDLAERPTLAEWAVLLSR